MTRLPNKLCMQVRYIWQDSIGEYTKPGSMGPIDRIRWDMGNQPLSNLFWQQLYAELEREEGLQPLKNKDADRLDLFTKFITNEETLDALHAIEITFRFIDSLRPPFQYDSYEEFVGRMKLKPDETIDKLNQCFSRNNLSFEYKNGKISKINDVLS